jgi:glucose/arabinose dehydrogenase
MGRDFLGDNLPPDEINVLQDGADYGWPYCYGDKVWDRVFGRNTSSYCEKTVEPFYNLPAHVAPLGLTFINSNQFPDAWQNDLLVAYHGSWNSSVPVGYKVVRIETSNTPSESDFVTGFQDDVARPVDVIFDSQGSLFISDDDAGAIYKVIKAN